MSKEGTPTVLPKGATVLDFAIEVLEDKGLMCSGAMINKRFLPINYILKNAEQVDLILTSGQNVPHHWVDIPKTSKARRVLKNFFRREHLSILQEGKTILRAELKRVGLSLNKNIEVLLRDLFSEKTVEKTYYKIGSQSISRETLHKAIMILEDIKEKKPDTVKDIPIKLQIKEDVVVTGADNPQYQLAPCCLPIPDEEIFAVLTINEGMKIHRVDCPQAAEILSTQGRRVTKARWKYGEEDSFLVFLGLKAANRKGMTKDIVNAIKADVHIESLSFLEEEDYIKGDLTIEVENAKKLSKVIKDLEALKGVVFVERVGS